MADLVVYGLGSELIVEHAGQVRSRFAPADPAGYLGFADGTLVVFGGATNGTRSLIPFRSGSKSHHRAAAAERGGSDRLTLVGDVPWVVLGSDWGGLFA
jgi:hypothetical protein